MLLHGFHAGHKGVDFLFRSLFSDTEGHKPLPDFQSGEKAVVAQCLLEFFHRQAGLQDKFLEERPVERLLKKACPQQPVMKIMRPSIRKAIDFTHSFRSHEGKVYGHIKGHERLVGADVARRFLPPDMLFPRLQGQHEGTAAVHVDSLSHDSAGKLADEFLPACKIACIRASERQRKAEALAVAAGYVRPPFSRSPEHCK